jgi:anti-sigma B factor antagonist
VRTGLDVEWERHGGRVVIAAAGEVDAATAPRLRDAILAARTGSGLTSVVVDLSEVDYFDSTGLAVLAEAEDQCQAAGQRLAVVAGTRAVLLPLRITGLDRLLAAPVGQRVPVGAGER